MNIERQYQQLLADILENGVEKKDRTGTGTLSVFGRQIRHKMSEGFPLLTTKKMAWKSIVTELLWFLRGETNIKFLLDYDCHIWDGDAYKNYTNNFLGYEDVPSKEEFIKEIKTNSEFVKKWGELGPIYGKQWRRWGKNNVVNHDLENVKSSDKVKVMDLILDGGDYSKYDVKVTYRNNSIDQIANLINELKTNPDSRRLMVNAWNVGELDQMVLPPCHYGFQVYTRELRVGERLDLAAKTYETFDPFDFGLPMVEIEHDDIDKLYPVPKRSISLMWNQRSVDTFLGLPFNIASYALLLEIIAKEVNMVPDELIGNLGDVHLYLNHIEQAKEQMYRRPYDLPKVQITERNWYQHEKVKEHLGEKTFSDKIMSYRPECFELIGYESHPKIKAPLSN
jgi:thymidylate synthase